MTEDACDDVVELLKESVQPKPLSSNELNAGLRAGRAKLLLTDPLLMRMAGSYPLPSFQSFAAERPSGPPALVSLTFFARRFPLFFG